MGSKYASAVHFAAAIFVQVVQVKSCRTVWEASNCGNVSDMHRPCILSIIDFSLGLTMFLMSSVSRKINATIIEFNGEDLNSNSYSIYTMHLNSINEIRTIATRKAIRSNSVIITAADMPALVLRPSE